MAVWDTKLPVIAELYLDEARTDDAMDGYMWACGVPAVALPVIGSAVGVGCAAATYAMKTTVRVIGYCARYSITIVDPKHPRISFYRGGFCK